MLLQRDDPAALISEDAPLMFPLPTAILDAAVKGALPLSQGLIMQHSPDPRAGGHSRKGPREAPAPRPQVPWD